MDEANIFINKISEIECFKFSPDN